MKHVNNTSNANKKHKPKNFTFMKLQYKCIISSPEITTN